MLVPACSDVIIDTFMLLFSNDVLMLTHLQCMVGAPAFQGFSHTASQLLMLLFSMMTMCYPVLRVRRGVLCFAGLSPAGLC